jgi:hypothetical protein
MKNAELTKLYKKTLKVAGMLVRLKKFLKLFPREEPSRS